MLNLSQQTRNIQAPSKRLQSANAAPKPKVKVYSLLVDIPEDLAKEGFSIAPLIFKPNNVFFKINNKVTL